MTKTLSQLYKKSPPSVFICLLTSLLIRMPMISNGADQEQIRIIESNLSREKERFEHFDSREKDLLLQVAEQEKEVTQIKRGVKELEAKIRSSRAEILKLAKEQSRLEALLHETETKAAGRLVALYKYARKGYLKILTNLNDTDRFWQGVVYLRAISLMDRGELKKLETSCLDFRHEISMINKKVDEKEATADIEKSRLALLREDLEENVLLLMRIHQEKKFYETAVKELGIAAQDLKETIVSIEEKEQPGFAVTSEFDTARSKLPFPIAGKIIKGEKLFGNRDLNLNKGVFIEGVDREVRAVFPGRIDFSGNLKGYGDLIIINHGSRFYTISAQLSERILSEGDMVSAGAVIGLVRPNTDNRTRLYFEVRKAGKSLDPLKWLEK